MPNINLIYLDHNNCNKCILQPQLFHTSGLLSQNPSIQIATVNRIAAASLVAILNQVETAAQAARACSVETVIQSQVEAEIVEYYYM